MYNSFGVPIARQRDPFGQAYNTMMQAAMPVPVAPVVPPIAAPVQVPLQQYMGLPRTRPSPVFNVRPPSYIPRPQQLPNSPLQPMPNLPSMSVEDMTNLLRAKESSGNYQALNTDDPGNTASGAYQYTDRTWNNYGGYPKALLAPREVQDRRFAEDIAARYKRYNGDPFRMLAAHNLPAYADRPDLWEQHIPYGENGRTYKPLAEYLRYVTKGTNLEGQLDAYLRHHRRY